MRRRLVDGDTHPLHFLQLLLGGHTLQLLLVQHYLGLTSGAALMKVRLSFSYVIQSLIFLPAESADDQWLEACEGYTAHATFESKGRYLTGELDSLNCLVTHILVSRQPGIASTATATFEGGQTATTTVDRFLRMLPEVGSYALAFAGPDKGLVIRVERHDRDSRDFTGRDVKADKLASIREMQAVKVEYSS